MEKLNNNNYFSSEHNWKYTGSSQIKDFMQCEACAMAKLKRKMARRNIKSNDRKLLY
jgi:hypothetical protein